MADQVDGCRISRSATARDGPTRSAAMASSMSSNDVFSGLGLLADLNVFQAGPVQLESGQPVGDPALVDRERRNG
jgi:hypothetical protein